MATYMISKGIESKMVVDGRSDKGDLIGAWTFEDSELARKCMRLFQQGDARVDPSRFHQQLTSTRRSLFTFLENMG